MLSPSFFARQIVELIVNDVKKEFKLEKVVKSVIAAAKQPKPPKINPQKEAFDKARTELIIKIYYYFQLKRPRDEAVLERILAYYLVRYSTAGNGEVRLKTDINGRKKLKPYNPNNYFHRKKYEAQSSAATMLIFGCEKTQWGIQQSLLESLIIDGVMNTDSNRIKVTYSDLRIFEMTFFRELNYLFS